jgi:hypothetical protein
MVSQPATPQEVAGLGSGKSGRPDCVVPAATTRGRRGPETPAQRTTEEGLGRLPMANTAPLRNLPLGKQVSHFRNDP